MGSLERQDRLPSTESKASRLKQASARETTADLPDHLPRLLLPLPPVPWDHAHPPAAATVTESASAWGKGEEGTTVTSAERPAAAPGRGRRRRPLLKREDAPWYLTGNPYILTGFRQVDTLREAVEGLFYLHNSWLDTWTSVGSFVHSHILLYLAHTKYNAYGHDALASAVFFCFYIHVAWFHAPASVCCHLIGNAGISKHVHELSLEYDYVMIFVASLFLSFTQAAFVYPWYLTAANVSIAMSLTAYLATHLRKVVLCHIGRLRMLLEIGALYQIPAWVQAYKDLRSGYLTNSLEILPSVPYSLVCAVGVTGSLAIGGAVYALHLPERFAPGKFDIWWNSHSWMHVFINVAHFSMFAFVVHMFQRYKGEI